MPRDREALLRPSERDRVRRRVAAALKGEEYSIVEMAHDLERLATHPVWVEHDQAAQEVEHMHGALVAIANALGGGRINWEPNYPEVQHALRLAQAALAAAKAAS
jgi:hypothetical protein